jgi:similar to stage IV sporulation protein
LNENVQIKKSYSNVVAKSDGQIKLIRVFDGVKTVKLLDVVKKGDILISGIVDSQSEGVRYVHADGIINAYVNKHISVKIPMFDKIRTDSSVIHKDYYIKIFSKCINILKKGRNLEGQYDKIEKKNDVVLFGRIKLPISITQVKYLTYEYKDVIYSEKKAKELALVKLREELDLALCNAELLSKKINYYCDYEYYYIECDLYCIEDIAEVVEFQVVEK